MTPPVPPPALVAPKTDSGEVQGLLGLGGRAGGGGSLLGFGEGGAGVLGPPLLALDREGVDRVVVLVGAVQRLGVLLLDAGAVVLLPVRDAADLVVLGQLVHPALPDVRHVADDPRRREAGQVPEDAVLQV